MDWGQSQWLIWLGLAIVAGVAEVFTLNLVFAMIAGGALVAAVTALVTGNVVLATVMFALASAVLLFVGRPALLRYMHRSAPQSPMHTAALVGRTAEVLSEVTDSDGRVKLGGEIWSARTLPAGRTLEVGSLVRVIRIDGATAVVDAATLSIEE